MGTASVSWIMLRARVMAVSMALAGVLTACSAGHVRDDGPGYGPYDYDPYGRVDRGAIERQQARERERVERQQDAAREQLLRQQQRERRQLKQTGAWDATDKREQAKERRQQERRFDQQDRRLREHQELERDVYE